MENVHREGLAVSSAEDGLVRRGVAVGLPAQDFDDASTEWYRTRPVVAAAACLVALQAQEMPVEVHVPPRHADNLSDAHAREQQHLADVTQRLGPMAQFDALEHTLDGQALVLGWSGALMCLLTALIRAIGLSSSIPCCTAQE